MRVFFGRTLQPMIQPTSLSDPREGWVGSWLLALTSYFGDMSAVILLKSHRSGLEMRFPTLVCSALLSGYVGVCAPFLKWWKCFFFVLRLRFVYVYYLYPRQKKVK